MAGTNNFLPFCPTDTGTNLLNQSDYAAASDRNVGNQPGVAKSRLVNRALRQSAFVTSQVAQYLANKLDDNVVDNANTAALQAQLVSALAPNNNEALENIVIQAAVGSSELVIALKSRLGEDFSATDIGFASFRSATLSDGFYNRRSMTTPLSLTITSGSTLGQANGQAANIYVYLLDNAGDVELAVSGTRYSEDALYSTLAEGGGGGADSATAIYSEVSRSDVPVRLIGYLTNTQATAGSWASAPSKVQLLPSLIEAPPPTSQYYSSDDTWSKPVGLKYVDVEVIGGGGSSGGCASTGVGAGACSGAGGGGGYSKKRITAASLGSTESVVVGSGGAAPSAGNNNGNAGGSSSFGSHCSGSGGLGGTGGPASTGNAISNGGLGGTGSSGDLNLSGSTGGTGRVTGGNQIPTANGGQSTLSTSATSTIDVVGATGVFPGGGAAGSSTTSSAAAKAGGPGSGGLVIVTEYF